MTDAERLRLLELEEEEEQEAERQSASSVVVPEQPARPTSNAEAVGAGSLQALTGGFLDELVGAYGKATMGEGVKLGKGARPSPGDSTRVRALKSSLLAQEATRPTTYEMTRDVVRDRDRSLRDNHAAAYYTGAGVSSLAIPVPFAGGARAATAGGRVLKAALGGGTMGTVFGAGASEADTPMGVIKDSAKAGLWGAGGGALAGGLGEGLGLVASRAARGQTKAAGDAVEATQRAADDAYNSAHGSVRNKVGEVSRDLEVMAREAENLPPGVLKDKLQEFLNSPKALEMRELVASNKLTSAPERMGEHAALVAQREAALAARAPDLVQEAAQRSLENPVRTQLVPRLKTYMNRALPIAAGTAIGGAPGAAAGTLVANTIGRPTTAMAKAMQSPAMRHALWKTLRGMTEPVADDAALFSRAMAAPTRGVAERSVQGLLPMSRAAASAEERQREEEEALAAILASAP